MIAPHMMKVNGKVYLAGEVIPSPVEKPVEVVNESVNDVSETKKFTKREITFMKVAKLRELASEIGIENPDELTGAELKEILIDKLV